MKNELLKKMPKACTNPLRINGNSCLSLTMREIFSIKLGIKRDLPLLGEDSVAERLSYPLCKPGVLSSIPGFSSLSDETLNRGPVSV